MPFPEVKPSPQRRTAKVLSSTARVREDAGSYATAPHERAATTRTSAARAPAGSRKTPERAGAASTTEERVSEL